jgi:hypothetical protein
VAASTRSTPSTSDSAAAYGRDVAGGSGSDHVQGGGLASGVLLAHRLRHLEGPCLLRQHAVVGQPKTTLPNGTAASSSSAMTAVATGSGRRMTPCATGSRSPRPADRLGRRAGAAAAAAGGAGRGGRSGGRARPGRPAAPRPRRGRRRRRRRCRRRRRSAGSRGGRRAAPTGSAGRSAR